MGRAFAGRSAANAEPAKMAVTATDRRNLFMLVPALCFPNSRLTRRRLYSGLLAETVPAKTQASTTCTRRAADIRVKRRPELTLECEAAFSSRSLVGV